jgi:TATA-binding protein-associated factor
MTILFYRELLVECGLGHEEMEVSSGGEGNHRVLIFAQHKSTLDLIEELVFKRHLSNISYLRLDGNVEASARYPIVSKFNSDMTIDVLLLTTHVGGLGLNLTTADTVIFMDPDWNPMKDLQAMDRAHRLGQKRVVTVYRLLLQDTLEDRIMSLQRWKTRVAGTIITQQNSEAINHENLLDLFDEEGVEEVEEVEVDDSETKGKKMPKKKKSKDKSSPDWHDEDDSDLAAREAEYEKEFNGYGYGLK